jgi:3-phosphoshikimate 1-carboxyvinyltransferase
MSELRVRGIGPLRGRAQVPGDKSISHRALLLGALAEGESHVAGFLPSGDCLSTLGCLRDMGVEVTIHEPTRLTVHGRGLRPPRGPLNCGRSGTTMRLLAGMLAGQPFDCLLTGDPQLLRRPMRRVVQPLRAMGAEIDDQDGRAPLAIHGQRLRGYDHTLAVASAQVKSALLLAGLRAEGPTVVRQPGPARDHTERMLAAMGAEVLLHGLDVTLHPASELAPLSFTVPGDLSSAAFPLVAAALIPGSEVVLEGVGVNPTRTGLLEVLGEMGVTITLSGERVEVNEPVADLTVCTSPALRAVEIGGDTVVRMIDEFPVLAVAATQATGVTRVRDAGELRVKETDRIATAVTELGKMGARLQPTPNGFLAHGPTPLQGAVVESHGDHRLAMALAVAGLLAKGETVIRDIDCIADSFPGFEPFLASLSQPTP